MRNDSGHRRDRNRLLIGALAAIAILLSQSIVARAADQNAQTLLLGVHPYLSHGELQNRFLPLAHYLSKSLGVAVKVRVGRDYAEHVDEVGRDHIDIAYLGPISYVHMVKLYGRKPLLARLERNGKAVLVGHIVVPEHSPLRNVGELRGKAFAFGDPESTMSSVVPQAVLAAAGISLSDLSRYSNYRGHSNVALAVLSGQVDAGAVKSEVYEDFMDRGLDHWQKCQRFPSTCLSPVPICRRCWWTRSACSCSASLMTQRACRHSRHCTATRAAWSP